MVDPCPCCTQPRLTALDRGDVFRELELAAEAYEAAASYWASRGGDSAPLMLEQRAKAQRVRQLMTHFVEAP